MRTNTLRLLTVAALLLALGGCDDTRKKRAVGGVCTSHAQCESGVCGGGFCLTPDGDEDTDGLINILEASLGTNPVEADSDGDGKPDAQEIGGDPLNPTDTDGDGKIDAIESAIADVDGDCIPDELDANDAFSDLPSDAFPDACGDGRPFPDPGTEGPSCQSVRAILGGTCAEAVGVALVECFDPEGCVSAGTSPTTGRDRLIWENGAYQEFDEETNTHRIYSSSAQLCVEIIDISPSEEQQVYTYRASGQTWTITVAEDDSADVRCSNGTVVHVTAAQTDALGACVGSGDFEFCPGEIPGMCVDDVDCDQGEDCCNFGEFSMCVPDGVCPG